MRENKIIQKSVGPETADFLFRLKKNINWINSSTLYFLLALRRADFLIICFKKKSFLHSREFDEFIIILHKFYKTEKRRVNAINFISRFFSYIYVKSAKSA